MPRPEAEIRRDLCAQLEAMVHRFNDMLEADGLGPVAANPPLVTPVRSVPRRLARAFCAAPPPVAPRRAGRVPMHVYACGQWWVLA